jgi:hypothetical protein
MIFTNSFSHAPPASGTDYSIELAAFIPMPNRSLDWEVVN